MLEHGILATDPLQSPKVFKEFSETIPFSNYHFLDNLYPVTAILIILRNHIFKHQWPNCVLASIIQTFDAMPRGDPKPWMPKSFICDITCQSASLDSMVHLNLTQVESDGICTNPFTEEPLKRCHNGIQAVN